MAETTGAGRELVEATIARVATALIENSDYLTGLDQAMGDGDLGITTEKIGRALTAYLEDPPDGDLGKFFMTAGMKVNSAAPSTMGTLFATALMRAGKEARGMETLDGPTLAAMLQAADLGIQERGKAKPGDKTIVDALHPAAIAFSVAIETGKSLDEAGQKMLDAAQAGLEAVTPLQSRVGRASWVGERTKGQVDAGCAALVIILKAIANRLQ
jgi:dihydroxyacetone kinase-like protein